MEITLSQRDLDAIVHKLSVVLVKKLKDELAKDRVPEMVTTAEAAKILGITACRMRQIAHKYPHIKRGEGKSAGLLFKRDSLIR